MIILVDMAIPGVRKNVDINRKLVILYCKEIVLVRSNIFTYLAFRSCLFDISGATRAALCNTGLRDKSWGFIKPEKQRMVEWMCVRCVVGNY